VCPCRDDVRFSVDRGTGLGMEVIADASFEFRSRTAGKWSRIPIRIERTSIGYHLAIGADVRLAFTDEAELSAMLPAARADDERGREKARGRSSRPLN
jgi:hypothetical protein